MRGVWLVVLGACAGRAAPDDVQDADETAETGETDGLAGLRVLTWNTGGGRAGFAGEGGLTRAQADYSDDVLGNGLAWTPAVEAARTFLAAAAADVVAFQEILDDRQCADLPEPPPFPSVCDDDDVGDPVFAARLLGDGYQVACHPLKTDKCIGVRRAFGTIRGCTERLCDAFVDGAEVTGCGKGARVAAITVDLADGTAVRVVNVHGSSGIAVDDQACRVREFTAVFEGLDGQAPLVSSELPNVVMGDLNVDPARLAEEQSGAAWNALTTGWTYLTEVGEDTPATYAGAVSIDHVVSDAFSGSCVHPGVTPGTDDVFATPYFDHHPALCDVVR